MNISNTFMLEFNIRYALYQIKTRFPTEKFYILLDLEEFLYISTGNFKKTINRYSEDFSYQYIKT